MKTIYYDTVNEHWYHQDTHQTYTWGAHHTELLFHPPSPSAIPFHVVEDNGRVGPLIGVLTSQTVLTNINNKIYELLETLQRYVQLCGGLLFLFSEHDLYDRSVHGMVFHQDSQRWIRTSLPYPDIVYNRFPSRKHEKHPYMKKCFQKLSTQRIPFFNPSFFSKWDIYSFLKDHSFLHRYIPHTTLFRQTKDLEEMLSQHKTIYVKPSNGSKGKGIFTLAMTPTGHIQYENQAETKQYDSLYVIEQQYLQNVSKQWILQEAIASDCIDEKRYDLRILVHRQKEDFIISGIGIRKSHTQLVTTHTLNGGIIAPFSVVEDRIDVPLLKHIVNECGHCLSSKLGLIGEFSIDMVKSITNQYYILEVNAKPMIFDEPTIQMKGMYHLIYLFYELSGFSPIDSKPVHDLLK